MAQKSVRVLSLLNLILQENTSCSCKNST